MGEVSQFIAPIGSKTQQREMAKEFVKNSKRMFAENKKVGFFMMAWNEHDDLHSAVFDSRGVDVGEIEEMFDEVSIALDKEFGE